jgi:hypothetical protein
LGSTFHVFTQLQRVPPLEKRENPWWAAEFASFGTELAAFKMARAKSFFVVWLAERPNW